MKTALVLQGGGATGSWQAGVLEGLLQSTNFRGSVLSVIGTSIGGLNGALAVQRLNSLAGGGTVASTTHADVWTKQIGWRLLQKRRVQDLIGRSVSTSLLVSGPVYFVTTATVVKGPIRAWSGRYDYDMLGSDNPGLQIFQFGPTHSSPESDAIPALVATSAIPWLYGPVKRNDEWLADGGLVANLPADVVKTLAVDAFVLISPNPPSSRPSRVPLFHRIEQSMAERLRLLREHAANRRPVALPVYHLHPGHQNFVAPGMLNFSPDAARAAFARGEELGCSLSAWNGSVLGPYRV